MNISIRRADNDFIIHVMRTLFAHGYYIHPMTRTVDGTCNICTVDGLYSIPTVDGNGIDPEPIAKQIIGDAVEAGVAVFISF